MRSAHDHGLPPFLSLPDQGGGPVPLHDHGREHHGVTEIPVIPGHFSDILINQAQRPGAGQQGGHSQKPQGRAGRLDALDPECLSEAPERVGKCRADQQDVSGVRVGFDCGHGWFVLPIFI